MTDQQHTRLQQLKRALDKGAIDQDTYDTAVAAMTAQLAGSGAIAQGQDVIAVGAAGVGVAGDNYADINTGVIIQQGTRPGASKEDLRRAYLARILAQADQLPLFAGDSAKAQVRLSSVYTALLTRRSEGEAANERTIRDIRSSPEHAARRLSALDVLNAEGKLVLLGGPGSGKSTFVSFVALSMAGELLGLNAPNLATLTAPLPKEKEDGEEAKPQRWEHGALLPVHVTLRDLASQLPAPGTPVNAETVWAFICGRLRQAALEEFVPHLREELLKRTAERNERIRELAERPLLLTLIAQLQTEGGGTLPEKREELYDKAVEMLLNKWESMTVRVYEDGTKEIEPSMAEWLNAGRDDIRRELNRLAFEAHRDQPELIGTADIRQGDLVGALLNASTNRKDVMVVRLEEYLRDRAGILAAHGVGMY